MLRDVQRPPARSDNRVLLGSCCGGNRHVLELERHDVDATGKLPDGVEIVVACIDLAVGDLAGRRVVLGRERVNAVAEATSGHRKHAPQLSAPENADCGSGVDHEPASVARRTSAASSSRYAWSFARSSGREVERIAT